MIHRSLEFADRQVGVGWLRVIAFCIVQGRLCIVQELQHIASGQLSECFQEICESVISLNLDTQVDSHTFDVRGIRRTIKQQCAYS